MAENNDLFNLLKDYIGTITAKLSELNTRSELNTDELRRLEARTDELLESITRLENVPKSIDELRGMTTLITRHEATLEKYSGIIKLLNKKIVFLEKLLDSKLIKLLIVLSSSSPYILAGIFIAATVINAVASNVLEMFLRTKGWYFFFERLIDLKF